MDPSLNPVRALARAMHLPFSLRWLVVVLVLMLTAASPSVAFAKTPLTNGANHQGDIARPDQWDLWTFQANAGDLVVVSIGATSGTPSDLFWPSIRILFPDDTLGPYDSGYSAAQVTLRATQTGVYTVRVASGDSNHVGVGTYTLTMAKLPGAFQVSQGDEGGRLINGANHSGRIALGDVDLWYLEATAGEWLSVAIGETSDGAGGLFWPEIALVAPDGSLLRSANNYHAAKAGARAPQTGVYTVLVTSADSNNDGVGDYALTVAKAPGTLVVPTGDEGGALAQGNGNTGAVHLGDLDLWTLEATAGSLITLTLDEESDTSQGLFWPSLFLIMPDGAPGPANNGYTSAHISHVAQQTGTYAVLVQTGDSGNDGTGTYRLSSSHAGVRPFSYAALGDSYSAGEGVPPPFDTSGRTNCSRSNAAHPLSVQIPGAAGPVASLGDTQFDFLACTGAAIDNVRAGGAPLHGEPPQLAPENGVNAARDLVTLTIGGNDVGFTEVLKRCLYLPNCQNETSWWGPWSSTPLSVSLPQAIATMKGKLVSLLSEIRSATPNAATLIADYPVLLSGQECSAARVPLSLFDEITASEQNFLRSANSQVNSAIAAAAAEAGVHLVQVASGFAGHEVCGNGEAWINGVVALEPSASFHPNALGHAEYARAINALLTARSSGWAFGYLPNGLPRNPDPAPPAPAPSTGAVRRDRAGRRVRVSAQPAAALPELGSLSATPVSAVCRTSIVELVPGESLNVSGGGFAANEAVAISLVLSSGAQSTTVPLGTAPADALGVLNATLALPGSLPLGAFGTIDALGGGVTGAGRLLFAGVRVQPAPGLERAPMQCRQP
jgi:lysophospholipase L1-like esterase